METSLQSPAINLKQRIARQFGRAAADYDHCADVQWHIAQDALQLLPASDGMVLDIGAGTGKVTRAMLPLHAKVIGLDLAEGMLKYAQQQARESNAHSLSWVAGDGEKLPFLDNSFEALFSSMALQWCGLGVFSECYRVMKPAARGVVAIMSQGSFQQWQQCWQQIDSRQHINQFPSHVSLQQAAERAGFAVKASQREYMTYHPDVRQLLGSIKSIGANVVTETANAVPLTRRSLAELNRQYEQYRNEQGLLPLGYRISFLQLHKR
ncbi:methyltransferase domain-containing protein [Neptunicella sp. SCSIO 80796]|uniref:methyltransferase domain-containing protein n=1 Tax=Neptunicella plasticusilytica TaxID=3117012 RepID=UPI003A4DE06D